MRTKEYDVQFNDGRLSIVRLRDGAPVVDSVEIPADAVGAAVQVLSRTGVSSSRSDLSDPRPVGSLEQPELRSSGTPAPASDPTGSENAREPRGSANWPPAEGPSPSVEEQKARPAEAPAPKRARKKKTVE